MPTADPRPRGVRRIAWAILVAAAAIVALAIVRPDLPDRAIHPTRNATTGTARQPLDRYVAAARAVLGPGDRIAAIGVSAHGPVVVTAAPAAVGAGAPPPRATLFLDPPTARVLEVVHAKAADPAAVRPAAAALSADAVVARAEGSSRGATLRRIAWPTERSPDWTVSFADGGRVKVADDSGRPVAVPARDAPGVAGAIARLDGEATATRWPALAAGMILVALGAAMLAWARRRR